MNPYESPRSTGEPEGRKKLSECVLLWQGAIFSYLGATSLAVGDALNVQDTVFQVSVFGMPMWKVLVPAGAICLSFGLTLLLVACAPKTRS